MDVCTLCDLTGSCWFRLTTNTGVFRGQHGLLLHTCLHPLNINTWLKSINCFTVHCTHTHLSNRQCLWLLLLITAIRGHSQQAIAYVSVSQSSVINDPGWWRAGFPTVDDPVSVPIVPTPWRDWRQLSFVQTSNPCIVTQPGQPSRLSNN